MAKTPYERRELAVERALIKLGIPAASPTDGHAVETVAQFVARWKAEYNRIPSAAQVERAKASGRVVCSHEGLCDASCRGLFDS